jgi:RNA polymerase sigma-70 factor (ECF subfamily)
MSPHETAMGGPAGGFRTTRWSLLRERDLASLVALYWRPVYLLIRRKGRPVEDAKDLTQEFFARFIEKDVAGQADPARGRFRSFLRAAVDHFCADARDRDGARKRGGDRAILPLDVEAAERALASDDPPEVQFDREWARAVLQDALRALEAEYAARGQSARFAELRPVLAGGTAPDRVALHRARRRFRELVRDRVALTVASRDEVDDEVARLLEAL